MKNARYIFLLLIKLLSTLKIKLGYSFSCVTLYYTSDINDHTKRAEDVTMKRNLIFCSNDSADTNANERKSIILIDREQGSIFMKVIRSVCLCRPFSLQSQFPLKYRK